jgi:hypothetical protein
MGGSWRLTRMLASVATALYGLGLLWLAPASPHRAVLYAFVGAVLLLHWALWHVRRRSSIPVQVLARSPRLASREVAGRYSQGVLGISTGLYVAGLARMLLQ